MQFTEVPPPRRALLACDMPTTRLDRLGSKFPRAMAPLLWLRKHRKTRRALFFSLFHLIGALTSIHAILSVRTAQGATAWAIALNTVPYVAVPAYWVFGRSDFEGYVVLRQQTEGEMTDTSRQLARDLNAMRPQDDSMPSSATLLERLAKM